MQTRGDDLPLFAYQTPRQIIMFPMASRIGRIRDVAVKILDKPTDRAAAAYQNQITDTILRQFDKLGIPQIEQDQQLKAFWQAEKSEKNRLIYCRDQRGGAA